MFWIFGRKPKADPPTEKQLNYAKRLGISVTVEMNKGDVSRAIDEAERKNPEAKIQRGKIKKSQREKKYGKEAICREERWLSFAESTRYMLAVYNKEKTTIVDVLEVSGAHIDGKGKIILDVSSPKLCRDPNIGQYLEWDKTFQLAEENLLFHEKLHEDFHDEEIEVYKNVVVLHDF